MKVNSGLAALFVAFLTLAFSFKGVTSRAIENPNFHAPPALESRGLTGPKPVKPKPGKGDGPDGGPGGSGTPGKGGAGGVGIGPTRGGLGAGTPDTETSRQLSGWGLERREGEPSDDPPLPFEFNSQITGEWRMFEIKPTAATKDAYAGDKPVYQYQINTQDGAFNTQWVETEGRNLPVNRRDMTLNSWKDAGGDPAQLKALGDENIINDEVRKSIDGAFSAKGKEVGNGGSIVVTPGEKGWDEIKNNPFIAGYQKMLDENPGPMNNAKIAKVRAEYDVEIDQYHLVTLLSRG